MANIFLISGNDESQIMAMADKIVRREAGENPDPFSFDLFQEGEAGPEPTLIINLLKSIMSPSFLGGRKTIWLKHFTGFDSEGSKTGPLGKALKELADTISKGIPDDIVLIMDGPGIDKRKALAKTCLAHGEAIFLTKPDKMNRNWQADMSACIQQVAKEKGLVLDRAIVEYLIDVLGTDTARIDSELEKIICYKGADTTPPTLEEVQKVCVGQGEEFNWAMGNVLGQRNLQECFRVIDVITEQSKDGDRAARSLILNAATYFRQALQIRFFMAVNKITSPVLLKRTLEGASDSQKQEWSADGAEFVMMHPYRVQMLAEQASRYTPQEIIQAIRTLRDALWQCISSSTAPRVSLENAMIKIIGVAARA
ncbi:MAG: hypothetical protein K5787_12110 [Lentisphaeria bacterium]|nr:hypothetical protein [Lentisphaeria bacterium]